MHPVAAGGFFQDAPVVQAAQHHQAVLVRLAENFHMLLDHQQLVLDDRAQGKQLIRRELAQEGIIQLDRR